MLEDHLYGPGGNPPVHGDIGKEARQTPQNFRYARWTWITWRLIDRYCDYWTGIKSNWRCTVVLDVIIPQHFLEYSALTVESANSTLGFRSSTTS